MKKGSWKALLQPRVFINLGAAAFWLLYVLLNGAPIPGSLAGIFMGIMFVNGLAWLDHFEKEM